MKKLIILLLITIFVANCTKIKEADPTLYIRGRVFLKDITTKEEITGARENFLVKLLKDSADGDYVYSTKTNSDGYFVFDIPSKDVKSKFFVICNGKVNNEEFISQIKRAEKEIDEKKKKKENKDRGIFKEITLDLEINLEARTYLFLKTFDTTNQPIPNSKIYLYVNQALATSGNTATASYTYAANPQGELKVKDVPKGIYYTKATAVYTSTVPISSGIYTVTIGTGSVTSETLILQ